MYVFSLTRRDASASLRTTSVASVQSSLVRLPATGAYYSDVHTSNQGTLVEPYDVERAIGGTKTTPLNMASPSASISVHPTRAGLQYDALHDAARHSREIV